MNLSPATPALPGSPTVSKRNHLLAALAFLLPAAAFVATPASATINHHRVTHHAEAHHAVAHHNVVHHHAAIHHVSAHHVLHKPVHHTAS